MKHKARYLIPGSLFPEETTKDLARRDPALARREAPEYAFAFTLYDVEEVPDLGPDFRVTAKPKNETGRYYLGGTVYTVAELEDAFGSDPDKSILISNIKGNGYKAAIHCSTGNWQPFEDGDTLLDEVASR